MTSNATLVISGFEVSTTDALDLCQFGGTKRRATQREPGRVQRWKTEPSFRIAKRAKKLGPTVAFADEAGLN